MIYRIFFLKIALKNSLLTKVSFANFQVAKTMVFKMVSGTSRIFAVSSTNVVLLV